MDNDKKPRFFGIIISEKILNDSNLTPADKIVYAHIASYARKVCYDSNDRISDRLGIPVRTVQRSLSNLTKCGLIYVQNGTGSRRKIYDIFEKPHKKLVLSKMEFSTGTFSPFTGVKS